MTIFYIIIGISVGINIALGIGIRNLIKQNEELEDTLVESLNDVRTKVSDSLEALRAADLKGSFESDDEVGVVFNELKSIIEKYKNNL